MFSMYTAQAKVKIPIFSMITSPAAIAWDVSMVTLAGFIIFILMTNLPLYMKHIQNMDVFEVGVVLWGYVTHLKLS